MRIRYSFLYVSLTFILGCSTSKITEKELRYNRTELQNNPYVILVSIDGYRHDYTDLYAPPSLTKLKNRGTSAESLLPVYPSKTYTNHYSIATGLYAENHGIVGNVFFDPKRNQQFKLSDRTKVEDGTWYGGEPIWVASEKQGLLSATFFWPGSEADVQGVRPSYFYKYDATIENQARVQQVKAWLELPEERRPHFITVYFSDVDTAGHKFGPSSPEVKEAVLKVDQSISQLLEVTQNEKLPINIIVVSDHGMQQLDPSKVIFLDDKTDLTSVQSEGNGPQMMLYSSDKAKLETIYQDLKKSENHYKIFKKENMPAKYHFSKNDRIGDLIISAEAPYSLAIHDPKYKFNPGNHGYDPDTTSTMRGIFYASGPHILEKKKIASFRNIHIYPFVMKLLGLQVQAQIDGSPKVLDGIFRLPKL